MEPLRWRRHETPLGTMESLTDGQGVWMLEYAGGRAQMQRQTVLKRRPALVIEESCPTAEKLDEELAGFFRGELRRFESAPKLLGTDFQIDVWTWLLGIPYGEWRTYGEIADDLGVKDGARAVGQAVGSNPVNLIVPCHRVIAKNGELTGYGGGIGRKRNLHELEQGQPALDLS